MRLVFSILLFLSAITLAGSSGSLTQTRDAYRYRTNPNPGIPFVFNRLQINYTGIPDGGSLLVRVTTKNFTLINTEGSPVGSSGTQEFSSSDGLPFLPYTFDGEVPDPPPNELLEFSCPVFVPLITWTITGSDGSLLASGTEAISSSLRAQLSRFSSSTGVPINEQSGFATIVLNISAGEGDGTTPPQEETDYPDSTDTESNPDDSHSTTAGNSTSVTNETSTTVTNADGSTTTTTNNTTNTTYNITNTATGVDRDSLTELQGIGDSNDGILTELQQIRQSLAGEVDFTPSDDLGIYTDASLQETWDSLHTTIINKYKEFTQFSLGSAPTNVASDYTVTWNLGLLGTKTITFPMSYFAPIRAVIVWVLAILFLFASIRIVRW